MKIVNGILALIFVVFAVVQFNDPDPLSWILIYLNMAIICAYGIFKKHNSLWLLITGVLYFVYACFLIPGAMEWFRSSDKAMLFDDIAKMQNLYIEETREFLGLVICFLALGVNILSNRASKS
jgi:hypothetical membrane protein